MHRSIPYRLLPCPARAPQLTRTPSHTHTLAHAHRSQPLRSPHCRGGSPSEARSPEVRRHSPRELTARLSGLQSPQGRERGARPRARAGAARHGPEKGAGAGRGGGDAGSLPPRASLRALATSSRPAPPRRSSAAGSRRSKEASAPRVGVRARVGVAVGSAGEPTRPRRPRERRAGSSRR